MTRFQLYFTLKTMLFVLPVSALIIVLVVLNRTPKPTLNFNTEDYQTLLDPTSHNYSKQFTPIDFLYQRLIEDDSDIPGFQPIPSFAKKWEISEDGKSIVFWLVRNSRFRIKNKLFTRGRVDAEDVVYSLNRVLSDSSLQLGNNSFENVKSIEAIGRWKVLISLSNVSQDLFPFLASGYGSIVPNNYTSDSGKGYYGSGPFLIDSSFESELVLVPNKSSSSEIRYSKIIFNNESEITPKEKSEYCYYLLINPNDGILGLSSNLKLRELIVNNINRESIIIGDDYKPMYSLLYNGFEIYKNNLFQSRDHEHEIWLDLMLPGSSFEQFKHFENILSGIEKYNVGYQLLPVKQDEWSARLDKGDYQMTIIGWENPFPYSYTIIEWEMERLGLDMNGYLWENSNKEMVLNQIQEQLTIIPLYSK